MILGQFGRRLGKRRLTDIPCLAGPRCFAQSGELSLDPGAVAVDVGQEARVIGGQRATALEQLRCRADRGDRGLQLVGDMVCISMCSGLSLSLQGHAQGCGRDGSRFRLTAANFWSRSKFKRTAAISASRSSL